MVDITIPLKTWWWASWWWFADYETTVDGNYSVYSAQLKNYPVINAFTEDANTSQEKRWFQLTSRSPQNTIRQSELSFWLLEWLWIQTRKSLTYDFVSNIKTLDSGNIQTGAYLKWPTTQQKLLYSSTQIQTATEIENQILSISSRDQTRTFVGVSWWNRFLINNNERNMVAIPVDANNNPTWVAVSTEVDDPTQWNIWVDVAYANIACVIGDKVWVWLTSIDNTISRQDVYMRWDIYTLNSDWTMTLVWWSQISLWSVDEGVIEPSSTRNAFGSYVDWNTAYCVASWVCALISKWYLLIVWSLDLSNTTTFSFTVYLSSKTNYQFDWDINVWYDSVGDEILFVDPSWNIRSVDNVWTITDTWSNFDATSPNAKASQSESITIMSSKNNFVLWDSDWFLYVNNNTCSWTVTDLHRNLFHIYECDWVNNSDTWFYWSIIQNDSVYNKSIWVNDNLTIKLAINWTDYETKTYENIINQWFIDSNFTLSSVVEINSTDILFELEMNNQTGKNIRFWFGITGWNYDSPVWNFETSTINVTL